MNYFSKLTKIAGLGSAFVLAALAQGQQYSASFTINNNLTQPIYDVLNYMNGPGYQDHDFYYGPFGQGTSTLDSDFTNNPAPQTACLLGLVDNLPNDGGTLQDPVTHVVLFMDDTAATDAKTIAWTSLFRNTDEDTLISDIKAVVAGVPSYATDAFMNGDAQNGILNPDGTPQSAWFTLGGSFTIETWSGGQIIGSGTSTVNAVPEPAPFAALGLGALGLLLRRRKKA